jgi:hypothetical protein
MIINIKLKIKNFFLNLTKINRMQRLSNKKKNEARSPLKYIKIETKQKISQ